MLNIRVAYIDAYKHCEGIDRFVEYEDAFEFSGAENNVVVVKETGEVLPSITYVETGRQGSVIRQGDSVLLERLVTQVRAEEIAGQGFTIRRADGSVVYHSEDRD